MTEPAAFVPPEFIGIEVTRRCNLRCPHCYTASGGPGHPGPSTTSLMSLHDRIVAAGVRKVAYSGGEPLVRGDLMDVMRHGREHGIEGYGIVTNGFYVTAEKARALAAVGLTVAQVSLDGVDAADHCDVRGCGPRDFYRAVRAIRFFRDAGVPVDVACLLTGRTVDRRHEMALFCEALGVRALRFCTFIPAGRGVDDPIRRKHAVEPGRLDAFLKFMRDANRRKDAPIRLLIDHGIGPWNDNGSFTCRSGSEVAYVSAEGDLYPCPGVIFDRFRVGNVFETPLRDLLASPAMARMRNLRKADTVGACATCPDDACSGGCRGASYAVFGDENHAPPYCSVYRI